ncbi:MAG: hypothetical protein PHI12_08745 [Dehalococcoidales bacterium]|nr:hypothetical protein [Dehalococcoidales bacterium]
MPVGSYSNALLKFVLVHYVEIMHGKITPAEMSEFTKSAGRKNPLETAMIWRADLDQAIHSLSPRGIWAEACKDMTDTMLYHLGRLDKRDDSGPIPYPLSTMQRVLVNDCILKGCGKVCKRTCGKNAPDVCWNENIITRLRHFLNGEGRDQAGRFKR